MRVPISFARGAAKPSAPLGQTVVHAPQPTHRCGSTTMPPLVVRPLVTASLLIAAAEQTSMHAVQPIWPLRVWAQSFCR